MPRLPRADLPGSWHHVFNRAIARRTLFERREDYRFFLSQLAYAVRRGEIELHAYCLLDTHYHLLLRSPEGKLGAAMQRVQLAYSRWFNRSRRRDGSLVRGRYRSKPVHSLRYRRLLVRYIDSNPCSAGLVSHPSTYQWGSAFHHSRARGPRWLDRGWVESEAALACDVAVMRPEHYWRAFPLRNGVQIAELVHARLAHGGDEDPCDGILDSTDARTRAWMMRKAILADGTRPGLPLLSLSQLLRVLEGWDAATVRRGESERDARAVAFAGLGRDLCGATLSQLASRHGCSLSSIRRLYAVHRAELEAETAYAAAVTDLSLGALRGWGEAEQGGW